MLRPGVLFALCVGYCCLRSVSAQPGNAEPEDPFAPPMVQVQPVVPAKAVEAAKKTTPAAPPSKSDAAPSKSSEPHQFSTKLIDDSQMKIEITEPVITIVTKYGTLNIPTDEINRLEVGLRYPAGIEEQINQLIRELGSDAFNVRDAAEKKILALQELGLPAIRAAMKDSDKEISSRAKRMLEQLQTSLPEEKFQRKTSDLIVTDEFSARGKIELSELQIRSRIFGPAKLALHEIRNARSIGREDNSELTIDAAQYGKPNRLAWLDTGFDVETENSLQIEASGQVDLLPQNPGQMLCGPTGFPNNEMSYRNPNGTTLRVSNGALLGRIGTSGPVFVVGGRYKTGRPSENGRLFLQIAPSSNGNDPSGSYKVKITQGE